MKLKILLPFKIYSETLNVKRIVVETKNGSFGLLPKRLDCAAALVPGILEYEDESSDITYVAIDEGVLVKTGSEVMISVRNAIGGNDLLKLREAIKTEFSSLNENEKQLRTVMTKMSTNFLTNLDKFYKD
jgi:F-type H+-transporting ATPase subunit epsilon